MKKGKLLNDKDFKEDMYGDDLDFPEQEIGPNSKKILGPNEGKKQPNFHSFRRKVMTAI